MKIRLPSPLQGPPVHTGWLYIMWTMSVCHCALLSAPAQGSNGLSPLAKSCSGKGRLRARIA